MKIAILSENIKLIKESIKGLDYFIKSNTPLVINKCPQSKVRVLNFVYSGIGGLCNKIKAQRELKEAIKGFIYEEAQYYI